MEVQKSTGQAHPIICAGKGGIIMKAQTRTWKTLGNWAIVALLLMGLVLTTLVAVQQLTPAATTEAVAWDLVPFPPPPPYPGGDLDGTCGPVWGG
jgi:hypothetical protein